MLSPVLLAAFPDLDADGGAVTHPPDPGYNCVAWAAGVTDAVWWPADPDGYWPPGAPDELTVAALVAALGTAGYTPCGDGGYEPGFEKVAGQLSRPGEAALLAEAALAVDWNRPEEDAAWAHLQPET